MSERKTSSSSTTRKPVESEDSMAEEAMVEEPKVESSAVAGVAGVVSDLSVDVTAHGLSVTVQVPLATSVPVEQALKEIQTAYIRASRFARRLPAVAKVAVNAGLDGQYVPSEGKVIVTQKRELDSGAVSALKAAVAKTERPLG